MKATDQVTQPGRRLRRVGAVLTITVLLCAGAAVATFRRPLFQGNFGVVDPGRVYRAAQPDPDDWPSLLDRYHPASVLNLRGGSWADSWYAAEVDATRAGGVRFYDLPMSATRRPAREELLALLDLLDACRYPLLIHCKSGSDRTGLAVGLYLMSHRGWSPERALSAFTLGYGHVPLLGPERLHEPFQEYADWLQARGLAHSPDRFRHWLTADYRSDRPPEDLPPRPIRPGPRMGNPLGPRPRRPIPEPNSPGGADWGFSQTEGPGVS